MSHDWGYDEGFDEFLAAQLERILRKLATPSRSEQLPAPKWQHMSDMQLRASRAGIGAMGPKKRPTE